MNQHTFEHEIVDRSDSTIETELLTLNANLNAATYRFLVLIREFDLRVAWGDWGMRSMAHWLGWRCGIGIVAAREQLRVAHALVELPDTAALLAEGRISYSKVRAITRVATADTEGFFLNVAQHGTAGHLERIVRHARSGLELDDPDRLCALLAKSFCDWHYDDDGMLVLRARLMPDDGARLVAALNATREREVGAQLVPSRDPHHAHQPEALPMSAQRAHALAVVAEAAAAAIEPKGSVPQIVVHIVDAAAGDSMAEHDSAESCRGAPRRVEGHAKRGHRCEDDSAESDRAECQAECGRPLNDDSAESHFEAHAFIENAVAVPITTVRRMSCDAAVVPLLEDADGEPLSIGRRRRTIPSAIRRALQTRDSGCRFPGCTHTRFLHGHHVQHWADGGHTALSNLVTLCSFHHRLVHEGGFEVQRDGDGRFVFRTPSGQRVADVPRTACASASGADAVEIDNARFGVVVSASTGDSLWDGRPVDYDHVMFTFFARGSRNAHGMNVAPCS